MKRTIFYIMTTLLVCNCSKKPQYFSDVYNIKSFDSVYIYKHYLDTGVMLKDSLALKKIYSTISKGQRENILVPPAYYGTITFFSMGDTLSFNIHGNVLDNEQLDAPDIVYKISLDNYFNSLLFKK